MEDKAVNIIIALLCSIPVFAACFILSTNGMYCTAHFINITVPLKGECIFKEFTGYNCPVCGMTRCFISMAHGNISNAWHYSHSGVTVFFLCVYETLYRVIRLFAGRYAVINSKCKALIKGLHIIETALLIIVCCSVAFCFIIQFFNKSLV